ncbi:MAG: 8-oxo-dGTP diphosphatase [Actinomycetota bacterium]|nr:8-oxo-dGTP diphosphatase [Actinomycetota bacterium]
MNGPRGQVAVEVAVGAIVQLEDTLLLVRRGRDPGAGQWSIPGGRVGFGESLTEAVEREVLEETALRVRVERFAGWVERIGDRPAPYHYVILDFFATELEPRGTARAGDDASDVQWVPLTSLADVDLVDGLADFLASVGVGDGSPG